MYENINIANGWYQSFSRQMADLTCENMRPFVPEGPAYSPAGLRGTDGIREEVDSLLKTSRGAVEAGDVPYFVQDDTLISLAEDGTITTYANLAITGTGRVSMAASSTIIWIVVPGGNAYYFDYTATQTVVNGGLDPQFLGPCDSVTFFSSFFFFSNSLRTIIFNADLDGISFTSTSFGTAEVNPDPIQGTIEVNNQFYAIGTLTIQPYRPVPGAGFPLTTVTTSTTQRGMSARFGFAKADGTFFFLGGGDKQESAIWRFNGGRPIKVSTPAIDHFIQGLSNAEIKACFAWSYMTEGDEYVGFTFSNKTLVYQIQTSKALKRKIWHERTSSGTRWRANTFVRAYNKIYVGDERTEKIGVIDPLVFTEYGDTLHREFTTQPFQFKGAPAFAGRYEMVMSVGVGNPASPDPVVGHEYSDNGVNFTPSMSRKMGKAGENSTRVVYKRKGRIPRSRVMKWFTDEPCETTFYTISAKVVQSSASA